MRGLSLALCVRCVRNVCGWCYGKCVGLCLLRARSLDACRDTHGEYVRTCDVRAYVPYVQ